VLSSKKYKEYSEATMVEKMRANFSKIIEYWKNKSLLQKAIIIGSVIFLILVIIFFFILTNKEKLVPLYTDLSLQETGQIKEELESRGINYSVENGGTTILVPEDQVDSLLVDLAAQGLPNSGQIDYSFFSENASWGMTDGQRKMIELDALQTEISKLINSIEGIKSSEVLITLPQESIFVGDESGEASASIVIHTEPGYQFTQSQINTLYHLVSKSVPNLPTDNIVLMNQYFEYFTENNANNFSPGTTYTEQQEIKKDIEQDIQQRVQKLLGTMIGWDNVVVSVTTDIDFTQEDRVEEIVEPVDVENMEGLPVSVERITETYTGNDIPAGIGGAGEEDVTNYPATNGEGESEYEMVKETINNEFNRIRRNIVESPYTIRDIGIQVAVDSKKDQTDEDGNVEFLTEQEKQTVSESISSILSSIISTSIPDEQGEINPEEKISIVFEEFQHQPMDGSLLQPKQGLPIWLYVLIGALILLLIILLIIVLRKKRQPVLEEESIEMTHHNEVEIPELETSVDSEEKIRMKQIENLAKEKPEDFVKLLRSWISED
jgi:flagellar M-ring protein FliF